MPDDSLIPGKKAQEIPLNGSVVSTVDVSPPTHTVDTTIFEMWLGNLSTHQEKWLRKSEQGDKWNRCLIEGMIVLSETGARDEQTTPP